MPEDKKKEKEKEELILADRIHPEYDAKIDNWEEYQFAAEGGDSFITDENLFTHRLEDSEDFNERLARAYYLNFCDTIPSMYNSYIFKDGVQRPPNEALAQFREDIDGKGTDASAFMKIAGYWASVFGVVHILVNMPTAKTKIVSKKDQKDNPLTPYLRLVFPTQLKDWAVDEKGNFKWVLIESTYYEDDDPKVERTEATHYMLITATEWEIQDDEGALVTFSDGSKNKGENTLGYIPIYTMYHKTSRIEKVGQSLLKDIFHVNRIIFNWCSCIDEQVERQTFSQLTVPDDGSLAEESERGIGILKKIGSSSIWTFNADAKHPPAYISPDVKNIDTIWKLIIDHIKEIFRLSGLQGGTSDIYSSRSGRQSQYNFLGVNSALAEKSASYQEAENQVSLIALDWLKNKEEYSNVQYATKFDVQALSDEISGIFQIMERNFSLVLNKELQKTVARKSIPHATQIKLKEIEDEIDSGSGEIVPLKAVGNSEGEIQEENGQGNPNTNLGESLKAKSTVDAEAKGKQAKE